MYWLPGPNAIPKFKTERNRVTYPGKMLALFRELQKEVRRQRTKNWLKKWAPQWERSQSRGGGKPGKTHIKEEKPVCGTEVLAYRIEQKTFWTLLNTTKAQKVDDRFGDSLCSSFQSRKLFSDNITAHSKQTINHHKQDQDKIMRGKTQEQLPLSKYPSTAIQSISPLVTWLFDQTICSRLSS